MSLNREIESIVNVTAYALLDGTGAWTQNVSLPADECVVRQISYATGAAKGLYLIFSNIKNDFIGSITTNATGSVSNPGTRIQLRNPLPNALTFQLMHPITIGSLTPATDTSGDFISINMDFIKYRS